MRKAVAPILSALALSFPFFANATAGTLDNPLGFTSITEFLSKLLQLVAEIGLPVIVLFIVFIGFRFIQSAGNPEELKKVRGMFFWALVGALLILGAQVLSYAIQGTVTQLQTGV